MIGPVPMAKQEAALIQRAYSEELSSQYQSFCFLKLSLPFSLFPIHNALLFEKRPKIFHAIRSSIFEAGNRQKNFFPTDLRRQLDSRGSLIEALRARLVELEGREARKEAQLVDQQRLLQEAKERHESELSAVESKYKAQVEINLLLESRILELHSSSYLEVATSSASPKERSPPLSGSLASSSEGSLAFHSGAGIMSDCCDSAGEIPNLQAIVEPAPSSSSQATTPSRSRRE